MQTKVLLVAIVENENGDILLRKKPEGSPPYKETWYIFGAEFMANQPIEELLVTHIKNQAGVTVQLKKQIGWDTEVKADLDGIVKQFIYLDAICEYVSGDITWDKSIEKIEWVPKEKLTEYDNVPPSVKLFKELGYIKWRIATHNGNFHTDDVFAIALLKELYPKAKFIRTRDETILDAADIVVDVGSVYDPKKKRFDHHQLQAGKRTNGIIYSGFGLVWKEYGLEYCNNDQEVWKRIDEKLVQHIDARDNGQKTYNIDESGVEPFIIDDIVQFLNPSSAEDEKGSHDERFFQAVEWAQTLLNRIKKKEIDTVIAERFFVANYKISNERRRI